MTGKEGHAEEVVITIGYGGKVFRPGEPDVLQFILCTSPRAMSFVYVYLPVP